MEQIGEGQGDTDKGDTKQHLKDNRYRYAHWKKILQLYNKHRVGTSHLIFSTKKHAVLFYNIIKVFIKLHLGLLHF